MDNLPPGDPISRINDITKRLSTATNTTTVQFNAGGAAVWLSVGAALFACFATVIMAIALLYVALQQANHGHQLNAIYRVAPALEQQVKAELAKKEEAE